MRDGELLEVAAHDAVGNGVVFYTLEQRADAAPARRSSSGPSSAWGVTWRDTLGVPGLLMFSTTRPRKNPGFGYGTFRSTRAIPPRQRFGGWFVTGSAGSGAAHGKQRVALDGRASANSTTVEGLFDRGGLPRDSRATSWRIWCSRTRRGMTNLLTRASWEARAADPTLHPPFTATPGEKTPRRRDDGRRRSEVVDYLLFVDEAKLTEPVRGGSGFAERFSSIGPRDQRAARCTSSI